jgi:hypothetical protein
MGSSSGLNLVGSPPDSDMPLTPAPPVMPAAVAPVEDEREPWLPVDGERTTEVGSLACPARCFRIVRYRWKWFTASLVQQEATLSTAGLEEGLVCFLLGSMEEHRLGQVSSVDRLRLRAKPLPRKC